MPKNRRGPLLIRIETCPRTTDTEPCSEECALECLTKPYTIFEPKPRRKYRDLAVEEIEPLIVEKISQKSSKSSYKESLKSETSFKEDIIEPKLSDEYSGKEEIEEPIVIKENISKNEIIPKSMKKKTDCSLQVCILEKHDKTCENWKKPEYGENILGDYCIISRQFIKLCDGPPISLPEVKHDKCVCDQSTNIDVFSTCPICSQCPCHFKRSIFGKEDVCIESYHKLYHEQASLRTLSEPGTYIESLVSQKSISSYELPNFRNLQVLRVPKEEKSSIYTRLKEKLKRLKHREKKNQNQNSQPT